MRIYQWLDSRLNLKPVERTLLDEPIPGGASWIYVFGSATLFLFLLQAVTGMFLAIYYAPTPDHAYDSIQFIEEQVTFGAFVRGLHHWGASAMVVAIGLHMLQTFLYGAYKPPREVMWMVGVVLFLIVMAFAFTGYLLPWDQTAYWATQIGLNMVGTVPVVGEFLMRVMRGGEVLGALTLSRFFAVHVLFLPALLVSLIAAHLFILRRVGPAGPWTDERASLGSETFYPRQVYMDAVVMLVVFTVISSLALLVPFPLTDKANPSDTSFVPGAGMVFSLLLRVAEVRPWAAGAAGDLGAADARRPWPAVLALHRQESGAESDQASGRVGSGGGVSCRGVFPAGHLAQESLCRPASRSGGGARDDAVCRIRVRRLSPDSWCGRSGRAGFILRRR